MEAVKTKKVTKKVMSSFDQMESVKEQLDKGWKTKDGMIPFANMDDNYLGKVSKVIDKRVRERKQSEEVAGHEIYNVNKMLKYHQDQIDLLLQQKTQLEKQLEIAVNSAKKDYELRQECDVEIQKRGKSVEELFNS